MGYMARIYYAKRFREYIPVMASIEVWCDKMFEDKYKFVEEYRYSGYCSIPQEEWDKCIIWWKQLEKIEEKPSYYNSAGLTKGYFEYPSIWYVEKGIMKPETHKQLANETNEALDRRDKYYDELKIYLKLKLSDELDPKKRLKP